MEDTKGFKSGEFRYNWYEINIARFLSKYNLPVSYQDDFLQFVIKYKEQFLLDFKNLLICGEIPGCSKKISKEIESLYSYIETLFNNIISVINYWELGELSNAESMINEIFNNVEQDFCLTTIKADKLFRVRVSNFNEDFSNRPLHLFHIPYHNRHLARNDRYNMAGRLCLYLSSRLNLAWKECGMPRTFYYAKFEYKTTSNYDWKYLYFPSPLEVKNFLVSPNENTWKFIIKYLKSYPLVFICSIVNIHLNKPYKPEYIFPQLLMQWIERNFDKLKGVVYFPCVNYDDVQFWQGYNVVLPAKNIDYDGYSLALKNAFTISHPSYQDNRLSDKSVKAILDLQEKLSKFMPPQNEMGDCLYNMDLIISRIVKLTKRIMQVDSIISNAYIEMLLWEIEAFKKEFLLDSVLKYCKDSKVYQVRYEEHYVEFSELYREFIYVCDIVYKYYSYLERGFEFVKP